MDDCCALDQASQRTVVGRRKWKLSLSDAGLEAPPMASERRGREEKVNLVKQRTEMED